MHNLTCSWYVGMFDYLTLIRLWKNWIIIYTRLLYYQMHSILLFILFIYLNSELHTGNISRISFEINEFFSLIQSRGNAFLQLWNITFSWQIILGYSTKIFTEYLVINDCSEIFKPYEDLMYFLQPNLSDNVL